jgi:hypothetical protein
MIFGNTLLSDEQVTAEFKQYVHVNNNFDAREKVLIHVPEVESRILTKWIGRPTLALLNNRYQADPFGVSWTDDIGQALALARICVAKLAMAKCTVFIQAQYDVEGLSTMNKNDQRTAAFEPQTNRIIRELLHAGNDALEDLLVFLESKLAVFTAYAASDEYLNQRKGIVKTAIDFNSFAYINASRITFNTLLPTMHNIEIDRLEPQIPAVLYAMFQDVTAIFTDPIEKTLLRMCKKAVVHQTIYEALDLALNFMISENGLRVHYTANFVDFPFSPPNEAQIDRAKKYAKLQADNAWAQIPILLNELYPPLVPVLAPANTAMIYTDLHRSIII